MPGHLHHPLVERSEPGLVAERAVCAEERGWDHAIDRDDCGCAYPSQHDRELGQRSVEWRLAHTDRRSKDTLAPGSFGTLPRG